MTGGEKTDLFVDPLEAYNVVNSPTLVFDPDEAFLLSAKVNVAFASDYDPVYWWCIETTSHGLSSVLNYLLRISRP